jgi:hypothetical protein
MGYAEHDGNGLGGTPALEGFRWAGEDRVRYADSGPLPGSRELPDSGGLPDAGLPGREPADDGPNAQAGWSADMTTGAYPIIRS